MEMIIALDSCGGQEKSFQFWMEENYPEIETTIENTLNGGLFDNDGELVDRNTYWDEYCSQPLIHFAVSVDGYVYGVSEDEDEARSTATDCHEKKFGEKLSFEWTMQTSEEGFESTDGVFVEFE